MGAPAHTQPVASQGRIPERTPVSTTPTKEPSLYVAREPIFPKRVYGQFRNLKWWLMAVLLGMISPISST